MNTTSYSKIYKPFIILTLSSTFIMQPTEIISTRLLSNYLRMDLTDLEIITTNEYLITDNKNEKNENILNIFHYSLPKRSRSGGLRNVFTPCQEKLKTCLKILAQNLNKLYSAPTYVTGFVKGKSIKSNAELHLSKKNILALDINNFFEFISSNMITKMLISYGFLPEVAEKITKIVTVDNRLAQGFHTSPVISNMIFQELDEILEKYNPNFTYSRYADDLTFSTNFDILDSDISNIIKILEENGFKTNREKIQVMRRGKKQYVTGLTVFDKSIPRIPKRRKKQIRLVVHYIKKYGITKHVLNVLNIKEEDYNSNNMVKNMVDNRSKSTLEHLKGVLFYIHSIEPNFANKQIMLLPD